jgi:hypothetical protein
MARVFRNCATAWRGGAICDFVDSSMTSTDVLITECLAAEGGGGYLFPGLRLVSLGASVIEHRAAGAR